MVLLEGGLDLAQVVSLAAGRGDASRRQPLVAGKSLENLYNLLKIVGGLFRRLVVGITRGVKGRLFNALA
jgi:hypothetical protein